MPRLIKRQLTRIPRLLCAALILSSLPAQADRLSEQRIQYNQAQSALATGDLSRFETLKAGLADYPLQPYLELASLRKRLEYAPHQEIEQFLTAHGDLPTAGSLKQSWLKRLAEEQDWPRLRRHVDTETLTAELECPLVMHTWNEGKSEQAMQRAAELWTVGQSQPDACDPLFKRWIAAGGLTDDLVWERIRLSLLHRQDGLAKYLTRQMRGSSVLAERFVATASDPKLLNQFSHYQPNASQPLEKLTDMVTVSLRRLGRDDTNAALALWPHYQHLPFTDEERLALTRDIGVRLARRYQPEALAFMAANDPHMQDDTITEWRGRLALRTGHWHSVQDLTRTMPEHLREQSRWRYWRLRSSQLTDTKAGELQSEYAQLAGERDFYGFLAAERSGQPYATNHQPVPIDPRAAARVQNTAGIIRAREFFARGEYVNARREWYHVERLFSREELIAQASLARQMDWYFPAIRGISKAQHWDDLDIRFPLAYREPIVEQARLRQLNSTWVYAITRQESGFMTDARSHAGALGLMQLMPATARETARRFDIPLGNTHDVLLPERNIALGTAYLSQLYSQFHGNRVLASAAYNAGPGRVRQWTRDMPALPSDIWIETIPFDETRAYVQAVLTYGVIYGEKLGIKQSVMEQHERYVE
ncbi:transglycosylase SLT domain-containing protein [Pseudomonas sp. FME51]|uniref:transglycosylase SLT domain-containing protein n=1 Tax=Pseudomonas sp. FME51 TaxID=2742609 RepID=UPI0018672627|nr:transglycosylase SLT domain-containing protein [Pseudomonas sp. FME51]